MDPIARTSLRRRYLQLAPLLALLLQVGCQSGAYRAANLPTEFRTQPTKQTAQVNFSQVAAPGEGANILSPGDLLEVTVASGRSEENVQPTVLRVGDDGSVDVPIVGPVPVAGLEPYRASQNISNLAIQRGMYRHPSVTVEIKSKAINRITVLGAVGEPGVHEIPRGSCDLVSALAAAGGLSDDAGSEIEIITQPRYGYADQIAASPSADPTTSDQIQLASFDAPRRAQTTKKKWLPTQTVRIDLTDTDALRRADYRLKDRDIVRVVSRKKEVIHVAGLVNEPGQFELPKDQEIRLLDAIAMAGGRSSVVADKVFVIRQLPSDDEAIVIQASLATAKQNSQENLVLGPGDTVTIEQTPATAVVDTVSRFFRLSFGVASNTIF